MSIWSFDEIANQDGLADEIARVKALEDEADNIFKHRDGSVEWRLRYDMAIDKYARAYVALKGRIEKLVTP